MLCATSIGMESLLCLLAELCTILPQSILTHGKTRCVGLFRGGFQFLFLKNMCIMYYLYYFRCKAERSPEEAAFVARLNEEEAKINKFFEGLKTKISGFV